MLPHLHKRLAQVLHSAGLTESRVFMNSHKAGEPHPLDELLGVDPHAFDEEEQTQVLSRSDPGVPQFPPTEVQKPSEREPQPESTAAAETLRRFDPATTLPATGAVELSDVTATPLQALPVREARGLDEAARVEEVLPSVVSVQAFEPPVAAPAPGFDEGKDPMLGLLVDGRYRVSRLLGVGGIGLVYLCQHELLEKPVAMKVLRPEYVLHRDLNERFLNEARAASAIKSAHIVDTIDVGTLANGAPFFVMEYVAGETLASLLEREGSLDLAQALDIARQAAAGLAAAHAAGVVHRDLKPENLFLAQSPDGSLLVKLFDFGIAKLAGARKRLTYVGAVFGTPAYMSPEQARGESVDARTDLYALGILIFEMVSGSVPFDAEDPLAIMAQHVDRPPPLLSSVSRVPVPRELEDIVARCLSKDPQHRHANASELLHELTRVSADGPSVPPLPGARTPQPETLHTHVLTAAQPGRSKRGRWLGALVGVCVAGTAVSFLWVRAGRPLGPLNGVAGSWAVPAFLKPSPRSPATEAVVAARAPAAQRKEVHFVVFPLDARVFEGERDLGPMPVSVVVESGKPLTLSVQRRGFVTRRVVVDGGETRVVVGLVKQAEPAQQDEPASRPVASSALQSASAKAASSKRATTRQPLPATR